MYIILYRSVILVWSNYVGVICQQIFSEFNHIFEKEEIWFETITKIFNITKLKSNAELRSPYEESVTHTLEGIIRY